METTPAPVPLPTQVETWYAGKSFTTDWTSHVLDTWLDLFAELRERSVDVLELGSWEGRSAVFLLRYLPHCRITCVDTFAGGAEHVADAAWAAELPHVEQRFRANVAEFGDRVRVLATTSTQALSRLAGEDGRFDLVYVDASHEAADVLADAEAAWPLVRAGGLVVFDDYAWRGFDDPARTPGPGIDAFLAAHADEYVERQRGWQLAVQRLPASTPSR